MTRKKTTRRRKSVNTKNKFKLLKTPYTEDIIENRIMNLCLDLQKADKHYISEILEELILWLDSLEEDHYLGQCQNRLNEALYWHDEYLRLNNLDSQDGPE